MDPAAPIPRQTKKTDETISGRARAAAKEVGGGAISFLGWVEGSTKE